MTKPLTILYVDTINGERNQETTFAGICRYATTRGWAAKALRYGDSRPDRLRALLSFHAPVAGCVVECADGRTDLPPDFFGGIPVVYLHAPPTLYGGGIDRIATDNESVARVAFHELSLGRPAAFAVVGFRGPRAWSDARVQTYLALAEKTGKPCFAFPWRQESSAEKTARLVPWISALPQRCAIFAVNDLTSAEVAEAAQNARRAIPRDLLLLGVDNNVAVCEGSKPALSSIQIDFERSGFVAARRVADSLASAAAGQAHDSASRTSTTFVSPLLAVRRRSTGGAGRREQFILAAVETIRREACEGLTAADLARRFRCSERLFTLRFREATGHSVLDEIQQARLEKVFTLLESTDTPVGAIADFCGYRTAVALRWIFRKRTGMSMSEWRLRNRR